MTREDRNRLSPWIEDLILGHGGRDQEADRDRLKAYVIGEGQVSPSQAQSFEGPKGFLLLTDGALQIPAVLTASAWEYLQEHEDRESYGSLLHATVHLQEYRLQLHVAQQPDASRFFLVVGALTTAAGGAVVRAPPCCSTLPSVKRKIAEAAGALRSPEARDTEESQDSLNLTDLLEQWHLLCVQEVLEDVTEATVRGEPAGRRPLTPRPSASAADPPMVAGFATGWDLDRVRFKREQTFSVRPQYLLIPEEGAPCAEASAAPFNPQKETAAPPVVNRDLDPGQDPEDAVELVLDDLIRPSGDPWDRFPPPCDSDSPSPTDLAPRPVIDAPGADHVATVTGGKLPVSGHEKSQQTWGHGDVPPYQKPLGADLVLQSAAAALGSSSVTPPDPNAPPRTDRRPGSQLAPPTEATNRKRKRPESVEAAASAEEAQVNQEPPSWLFDSQSGSEGSADGTPGQKEALARRDAPTVHGDGRPFSYAYRASGQNLVDLSKLRLSRSLLHWAVRYLVPPRDLSATSDLTEVTPL